MNDSFRSLRSHIDIDAYVSGLLKRVVSISSIVGNGFPVYACGTSSNWFHSSGGSWLGGYWAALWFLKAMHEKNAKSSACLDSVKIATSIGRKLSSKAQIDSAYKSAIFYYGICLGWKWFDNREESLVEDSLCLDVADSLAESFHSELLAIPLGKALGGGELGRDLLAVDYLPALIQLANSVGSTRFSRKVNITVDTYIHNGINAGVCESEYSLGRAKQTNFEKENFGQENESAGYWARGQAWAILGLVRAAYYFDNQRALYSAVDALNVWRKRWGNGIPLNYSSCSEGYSDPSASVIVAISELSLAKIFESDAVRSREYSVAAINKISAVCSSQYVYRHDEESIFWGACYKTREGLQMVESPWSSFYLLASLSCLSGLVDPFDI